MVAFIITGIPHLRAVVVIRQLDNMSLFIAMTVIPKLEGVMEVLLRVLLEILCLSDERLLVVAIAIHGI